MAAVINATPASSRVQNPPVAKIRRWMRLSFMVILAEVYVNSPGHGQAVDPGHGIRRHKEVIGCYCVRRSSAESIQALISPSGRAKPEFPLTPNKARAVSPFIGSA